MLAVTRERVFSKGQGPKRQKGGKPVVPFRPPKDVEDYLNEGLSKGNPKTDTILKALRLLRDSGTAMGIDWWEMERRANVAQVSIGTMLGRLALEGMYCEKKGKRGH